MRHRHSQNRDEANTECSKSEQRALRGRGDPVAG
jgi:hypothetical protein